MNKTKRNNKVFTDNLLAFTLKKKVTYKLNVKEHKRIMVISTTPTLEGFPVKQYLGVVTGETIVGANFFKDFMASIRDVVGGRAGAYERVLAEAKDTSLAEMSQRAEALGANAILGVDIDYETVGQSGSMLMVATSGTAVRI